MYCKHCGNHISDDSKFCKNCGTLAQNNADTQTEASFLDSLNTKTNPSEKFFSKKTVSVLCCVMIFILSLGLLSSVALRQSISEKRIKKMTETLDLDGMEEVVTKDSVGFIAELDAEKINRIFHETTVKEYVADLAVEYAEYMRGGKQPEGPKRDKIAEVFFDNWDTIEEIVGRKITAQELVKIKEHFDKYGETAGFGGVFSQEIADSIRALTSVYTILALTFLLAVFIFLLVRKRGKNPDVLPRIATPLIIASTVTGTVAAAKSVVAVAVTRSVGTHYRGIIRTCCDNVSEIALIDSAFVLFTGGVLIGIYLLKKFKKC